LKSFDFETVITKGGDKGETSLYSGERVLKYSERIEAIGVIDNLFSYLGIIRHVIEDKQRQLRIIQTNLMNGMSVIATTNDSDLYKEIPKIKEKDIHLLEKWSSKILKKVDIPQRFIVPGDVNKESAHIDYSRSLCRTAEREVVKFIRSSTGLEWNDIFLVQRYLNRLSDFLFILAREIEN